MTETPTSPRITRKHLTRLREIYRSSGWPCRDPLEVDLIVSGLVQAERAEDALAQLIGEAMREAARQADDRGLRRGVGRDVRRAEERIDRADIDDAALARLEMRAERGREAHRAEAT